MQTGDRLYHMSQSLLRDRGGHAGEHEAEEYLYLQLSIRHRWLRGNCSGLCCHSAGHLADALGIDQQELGLIGEPWAVSASLSEPDTPVPDLTVFRMCVFWTVFSKRAS